MGSTRDLIKSAVNSGQVTPITFLKAEEEIVGLMGADPFNRFKQSDLFKSFLDEAESYTYTGLSNAEEEKRALLLKKRQNAFLRSGSKVDDELDLPPNLSETILLRTATTRTPLSQMFTPTGGGDNSNTGSNQPSPSATATSPAVNVGGGGPPASPAAQASPTSVNTVSLSVGPSTAPSKAEDKKSS